MTRAGAALAWLATFAALTSGCSALLDFGSFRRADAALDAPDVLGAPDVLEAPDVLGAPDVLEAPDVVDVSVVVDAPKMLDAFVEADASEVFADGVVDAPQDVLDVPRADATEDAAPDVPVPSPAVQVAVGYHHSCARLANGEVWCWGDNEFGQLGDGSDVSFRARAGRVALDVPVDDIVAAASHTCARARVERTVYCWGANNRGQLGDGTTTPRSRPVAVALPERVQWTLSVGEAHTCARSDVGAVLCWGDNQHGQCGQPFSATLITRPAGVTIAAPVDEVHVGGAFSCARAGPRVFCWGSREFGQLGDGLSAAAPSATPGGVPLVVAATGAPAALRVGQAHACVRTATNRTFCWGRNDYGQLRAGTLAAIATPIETRDFDARELVAGSQHQCVLSASGELRCWGLNAHGQLATGARVDTNVVPAAPTLIGVRDVAAGATHTCAALRTGAVSCWGGLAFGEIGDGRTAIVPAPTEVARMAAVGRVVAGPEQTCVLTDDRRALCVGNNQAGQIGSNARVAETTFQSIDTSPGIPLLGIEGLALGITHGCALVAGRARCWGYNHVGQLGLGFAAARSFYFPQVPVGPGDARQLAVGAYHSCVLAAGRAWCWGFNNRSQIGNGATATAPIPTIVPAIAPAGFRAIAAGRGHTCVASDAGVVCWGSNEFGQAAVPVRESVNPGAPVALARPVTALTAGGGHTCALHEIASCWGGNGRGQLGNGTFATGPAVTAVVLSVVPERIVAGFVHTCASSGVNVWCWGSNRRGQLGMGAASSHATPVHHVLPSAVRDLALGDDHTCALTADRALHCWGSNGSGQLARDVRFAALTPAAVLGIP